MRKRMKLVGSQSRRSGAVYLDVKRIVPIVPIDLAHPRLGRLRSSAAEDVEKSISVLLSRGMSVDFARLHLGTPSASICPHRCWERGKVGDKVNTVRDNGRHQLHARTRVDRDYRSVWSERPWLLGYWEMTGRCRAAPDVLAPPRSLLLVSLLGIFR